MALTARIFPSEPNASARLKVVYDALSRNESRVEDFEAMRYCAYAMPCQGRLTVVGIGGLYRLLALDDESMEMASKVRSFLVGYSTKGAPLVDASVDARGLFPSLIWGGRMGISPKLSRSPAVSPFIYHHIFSTALATIERLGLSPVMLLFTHRDDNLPLRRLYKSTGFMDTGGELTYLDHTQIVLALHLHRDAPVLRSLEELKERALRRGAEGAR